MNESEPNSDQPNLPGIPSQGEEITLSTQTDRVMTALLVPGGNPVQELRKLDVLYAAAGESASAFVDTTARRLFLQPQVFDNLNFQSSLITGGSQFFGMVLRRMGELAEQEPALAEDAGLPVQIRLVEHHRRGKNVEEMMRFAEQVTSQLKDRVEANDTLALSQLAKVRYEESMGYFNQGDYERAIAVGEESIDLCDRAGDLYGVLAARGNTAGLFRCAWAEELGKEHPNFERLLNEGRPLLEEDLRIAQEELGNAPSGSSEASNFTRVEMNNALHLMKIADLRDDVEIARSAWAVLQENPVYQSAFDPDHLWDPAHAQGWAQPYPGIMQRLEKDADS